MFKHLGIPHEVDLFFRNYANLSIFYSALASFFGGDHSELGMLRRDGSERIQKWISILLYNLSIYMSINTSYR